VRQKPKLLERKTVVPSLLTQITGFVETSEEHYGLRPAYSVEL